MGVFYLHQAHFVARLFIVLDFFGPENYKICYYTVFCSFILLSLSWFHLLFWRIFSNIQNKLFKLWTLSKTGMFLNLYYKWRNVLLDVEISGLKCSTLKYIYRLFFTYLFFSTDSCFFRFLQRFWLIFSEINVQNT